MTSSRRFAPGLIEAASAPPQAPTSPRLPGDSRRASLKRFDVSLRHPCMQRLPGDSRRASLKPGRAPAISDNCHSVAIGITCAGLSVRQATRDNARQIVPGAHRRASLKSDTSLIRGKIGRFAPGLIEAEATNEHLGNNPYTPGGSRRASLKQCAGGLDGLVGRFALSRRFASGLIEAGRGGRPTAWRLFSAISGVGRLWTGQPSALALTSVVKHHTSPKVVPPAFLVSTRQQ